MIRRPIKSSLTFAMARIRQPFVSLRKKADHTKTKLYSGKARQSLLQYHPIGRLIARNFSKISAPTLNSHDWTRDPGVYNRQQPS